MAKISTYGPPSPPTVGDYLLGTDVGDNYSTKNFKIGDVLALTTRGTFYLTANQSTTSINTAIPVNFTAYNYLQNMGLTNYGYGPTALEVYLAGTYTLSFSLQLLKATSGDVNVDFWIRVNGVNVTGSNRTILVKGGGLYTIVSLDYLLSLGDFQYVEIYYSSPDLGVLLSSTSATGVRPSGYAAIATVAQV